MDPETHALSPVWQRPVDDFLAHLTVERRLSPRTTQAYRAQLTEVAQALLRQAISDWTEVRRDQVRGVIAEVVAENGKPVQFGQPLFKVR